MHVTTTVRMAALALCGATSLSCGDLESAPADIDAEERQAALLGIPGGFYNTPPSWGFCGYVGVGGCHGGYSFNSRGPSPGFLRRGVGMYRVTFENHAGNGNAQVVSASGNVHCNVAAQFPSGTGVGIDVFCRAPGGAQTDARFMLSFYRDTNVGGPLGGYANVSGVAPFATSNTWNSSGGPITVQGLAPGNYRVNFSGQIAGGDNAQVTALTSGAAYCTLGPTGWGASTVDVRCFTSAGTPTNVNFSVSYGRNVRGEPRNTLPTGTQGALVVVGSAGGVDPSRSRNTCQVGANTAVLQQPGNLYRETYHAVTATQAEVPLISLVSAMSGTGFYCNLNHFPIQGVLADSHGFVSCFTPNGASTTATHSSMFMIQDRGGC
jgi:hypothetical protein